MSGLPKNLMRGAFCFQAMTPHGPAAWTLSPYTGTGTQELWLSFTGNSSAHGNFHKCELAMFLLQEYRYEFSMWLSGAAPS